jgi:branched-chain amino acid transport system ATP-binding protein
VAPLLDVSNVTKRFGGLVAVDDVSFTVAPGEIVGILGPNGAGKTTLFNVLTGFLAPDAGSIAFQGRPLRRRRPHQMVDIGISRTFQLARPFHQLTVQENVAVACLSPRGAAHCRKLGTTPSGRARALLEQVGLGSRHGDPVETLSYGDLRRLEIARALATSPSLLLLDEPFAGLMAGEIEPIARLIRQLNEEGLVILLIEHKLHAFMKLVERVIAMNFGRIIASGSPAAVVNEPTVIEAYMGTRATFREVDGHGAP